jgi:uncharacterized protein YbjT (DUF2867 family)
MSIAKKRVLVTGGGTFLGDNIAAALLAEGAEVTMLVRPEAADRMGVLGQRVRWWAADVWNPASLKGRARGQQLVIHTVGGMNADPSQGLTHQYLNFISTRNVANLCVSSGVPQFVLLSAARAPWTNADYITAKRDAEAYIDRVGLKPLIIRAPIAYTRGIPRPLFWQLMSLLGGTPPISWFGFGRIAPIPIDVLARGVARIALDPVPNRQVYYASDLRRRNNATELRRIVRPINTTNTTIPLPEEDIPFGWTPETKKRE